MVREAEVPKALLLSPRITLRGRGIGLVKGRLSIPPNTRGDSVVDNGGAWLNALTEDEGAVLGVTAYAGSSSFHDGECRDEEQLVAVSGLTDGLPLSLIDRAEQDGLLSPTTTSEYNSLSSSQSERLMFLVDVRRRPDNWSSLCADTCISSLEDGLRRCSCCCF